MRPLGPLSTESIFTVSDGVRHRSSRPLASVVKTISAPRLPIDFLSSVSASLFPCLSIHCACALVKARNATKHNAFLVLDATPRVAGHCDSLPNNALRHLPAPSFAPAQGRTPSVAPARLLPCPRKPYLDGLPFPAKSRPVH